MFKTLAVFPVLGPFQFVIKLQTSVVQFYFCEFFKNFLLISTLNS